MQVLGSGMTGSLALGRRREAMALKYGDLDSQGRALSRDSFRLTVLTSYTLLKQRMRLMHNGQGLM